MEFIFFLIISATFCILLSKNIIQSLLYLILVFLLTSILFIYIGADFIGLIILIVYIGAISVLFLFIIMMLNIRFLEIYSIFQLYFFLALILCIFFLCQCLYLVIFSLELINFNNLIMYSNWIAVLSNKIVSLGELLFNQCYFYFLGATLLLFVAMIGAILLTLEKINIKILYESYKDYKQINWSSKSK